MTTKLAPAPVETVTPIKPSEAIRLGCLIAPVQLVDDIYADEELHAACVYGAMALGMGMPWSVADAHADQLSDDPPTGEPCPVAGCQNRFDVLLHLNDDHRWSRERIADWLAEQGL